MVSPSRCPPWQPERPGPTRREPRRAQRSYTTCRDTFLSWPFAIVNWGNDMGNAYKVLIKFVLTVLIVAMTLFPRARRVAARPPGRKRRTRTGKESAWQALRCYPGQPAPSPTSPERKMIANRRTSMGRSMPGMPSWALAPDAGSGSRAAAARRPAITKSVSASPARQVRSCRAVAQNPSSHI